MSHRTAIAVAAVMLASPVSGHHSDVGLDMNNVVTFEGVVTEYSMRNPHTYFTAVATNEQGEEVEWTVQMGSALTVSRRGWMRTLSWSVTGSRSGYILRWMGGRMD